MSLDSPSLPWRSASSIIMGLTGAFSRAFLFGVNTTKVRGLDGFLKLLDDRRDITNRSKGLLTGTLSLGLIGGIQGRVDVTDGKVNKYWRRYQCLIMSACTLDDPLIWGVLPFRYAFSPSSHRWAFGSHDICFTTKFHSIFFSLGQVLPAHRLAHSPHGGPFQPTMTQAIRVLSKGSFRASEHSSTHPDRSPDVSDPFTSSQLTYSTNGSDSFPAPSGYSCNSYGWIHIHPEGMVHQTKRHTMRYFKWGVARLILEPPECPDLVPMFIEGMQYIMPADRGFPRFLPRVGNQITVTFGDKVDTDQVFGDLRTKWNKLRIKAGLGKSPLGELNDELMHGREAVELRKECTRRVRMEVLKVRRSRGYDDEDPKQGHAETWRREGPKKEGKMEDDSWIEQG